MNGSRLSGLRRHSCGGENYHPNFLPVRNWPEPPEKPKARTKKVGGVRFEPKTPTGQKVAQTLFCRVCPKCGKLWTTARAWVEDTVGIVVPGRWFSMEEAEEEEKKGKKVEEEAV